MQSTNPKDIAKLLQLIRVGLANGLLTKEEIINWADKIITRDEQPDIFFIDLAMASSKSKNDIIYHFDEYLNFEMPPVHGRPLLGLLYKQYKEGQLDLEQAIRALFRLNFEAVFTDREEGFIYFFDDGYDLAQNNIYGSIDHIRTEIEKFLVVYKDYSIDNFDQWQDIDKKVDQIIENEGK